MIETLTVSLILAAVSGITFLAYKHPVAYKRIYFPILVLLFLIFLSYAVYNMGYTSGFYSAHSIMSPYIDSARWKEASNAFEGTKPSTSFGLILVIVTLVNGYLGFLYYLPSLLKDKEEPKQADATEPSKRGDEI